MNKKELTEEEIEKVNGGIYYNGRDYHYNGYVCKYCPECKSEQLFNIYSDVSNDTIEQCNTCLTIY